MKKKFCKNKVLALALVAAMILSLSPINALATEGTKAGDGTESVSDNDPFELQSASGDADNAIMLAFDELESDETVPGNPVIKIAADATVSNGIITGGTDSSIQVRKANATLEALTIENNINGLDSASDDGGGIDAGGYTTYCGNNTVWDNYTLIVDNCSICNNTAIEGGGAIAACYDMTVNIYNSVITKNQAHKGGALYFGDNACGGNIDSSKINKNIVTYPDASDCLGGAMYIGAPLTVRINNSEINSNSGASVTSNAHDRPLDTSYAYHYNYSDNYCSA